MLRSSLLHIICTAPAWALLHAIFGERRLGRCHAPPSLCRGVDTLLDRVPPLDRAPPPSLCRGVDTLLDRVLSRLDVSPVQHLDDKGVCRAITL